MNIAVLDIGGTSIKSGIYRNGKLEEKKKRLPKHNWEALM